MKSNPAKTIALLLFCLLSITLLMIRVIYTGQYTFVFLTWNLFLAYIPMGLSTLVYIKRNEITKTQFWLASIPWILFFPNAPYILTDLFHLIPRPGISEWFDLLLILSFAITGLLFGLLSLRNMHKTVVKFHSALSGYLFAITSIFMGSFGVYLGRFERYNSWDILRTPDELFVDIAQRLIHPMHHPATWGITLGMGAVITLLYVMMGEVETGDKKR
ncbi:MAG: DUF1361 domain-containing protein [Bacteroidia bacterium]